MNACETTIAVILVHCARFARAAAAASAQGTCTHVAETHVATWHKHHVDRVV